MVDIDLIKINYSKMPDERLLYLAESEGTTITYEAFIALKKEFRNRGLPNSIIDEIEFKRNELNKERIHQNLKREADIINNKLWKEVFQLKFEEASNDEIRTFLLDSGVPYEDSEMAIVNMKEVAKRILENTKGNIKMSIYVFIFSTLILVWNYNSFISIMTIYFGVIGFFSSAVSWARFDQLKSKYEKIIQNIEESE